MSILASEIQIRLSGGVANTDKALSIGGLKSSAVADNMFDDSQPAETTAGRVEYRCFYVHNANASLVLQNAVAWIGSNTASAMTKVEIGIGASAVNGTETAIASDTTAPAGVVFELAPAKSSALALGSIPAGQHRAIWAKRTVSTGAPASSDIWVIRIDGGSA